MLLQCEAEQLVATAQVQLLTDAGDPLPETSQVIGRGSHLHIFDGAAWYRVDVNDVRVG